MKYSKIIGVLLVCVLLIMGIIGCAKPAPAEKIEINLPTKASVGTLNWLQIERFKEIVDSSDIADMVEITLFSDAALGKDQAVLEGMVLGTHDATHITTVAVTVDPRLGIFDLPYMFPTRKDIETITNGPLGKRIAEEMPETGIRLVAYLTGDWRHVSNNIRPIYKPEDLKGLKIRTPKSPTRLKLFQLLGANPTPLPFGEVYTALQQGLIDGQENPAYVLTEMKFGEQQEYLSLTKHVYIPGYLLWSQKVWDTYPQEVQKALQDTADQVAAESWDMRDQLEVKAMEEVKALCEINEVDMAAFLAAAGPIYEDPEIVDIIGRDFVDEVLVALGRK